MKAQKGSVEALSPVVVIIGSESRTSMRATPWFPGLCREKTDHSPSAIIPHFPHAARYSRRPNARAPRAVRDGLNTIGHVL